MIKLWRRRGLTDKLYILNLLFTWIFTIICIVITIVQSFLNLVDFSIVSYGLPVVWAELSVHTGFIIWKSKAENMSKWGNKDNIQM